MLTLEELANLLSHYRQRYNEMQANLHQLSGAIAAVENQINLIVQKQNQNLKGESHAVEEGKQQESDSGEHQNGSCSGQEAKPSSGHCIQ